MSLSRKAPSYFSFLTGFWMIFLLALTSGAGFIFLVSKEYFGPLPDFKELENPKSNLASEIYSSDLKMLGKYYIQNRTNAAYHELSPHVINALLATEDIRFRTHSGIDFKGLLRVLFRTLILRQDAGGGSTISQQLAKNLFPREKFRTPVQIATTKIKEWLTAVRLERNYTKDEIIAMYLNTVPFGSNAYGIKSASRIFFNTTPETLEPDQAALMVGILKAPSWFSPVRHPDRALNRRNIVLAQMEKYHFISKTEYDSLKNVPVTLLYKPEDHTAGLATYFREYLRKELEHWCESHLKPGGTPYNLYKDGLRIYTTLDSRMQRYAEDALSMHLKELQKEFFKHWKDVKNAPFDRNLTQQEINQIMMQAVTRSDRYFYLKEAGLSRDSILQIFNKPDTITIFTWDGEKDTVMTPMDSIRYYKHFLQGGVMSMDPHTGHIKTWVGGIHYGHFQYDHVKQGKRQVGSAFKPFVYSIAIQEKWSPCYEVPNVPVIFIDEKGEKWSPKNSDNEFNNKMLTIEFALANSINMITAYVIKQFGPQAVIDLARKMGINSQLDPYPALCLGVADISVYEMVGAFSAYANKGVWTEPIYLLRIEDRHGNILEEFAPETNEAMSEETAWVMLKMLRGVVDGAYCKAAGKRIGTGVRLRFKYDIRNPVAGKTGTTQNYSDGWFVGITPDLVSGVWVGCEDRSVHFRNMYWGQGATLALPVWAYYMKKVYDDESLAVSKGDFEPPSVPIRIDTDCRNYQKEIEKTEESFDFIE